MKFAGYEAAVSTCISRKSVDITDPLMNVIQKKFLVDTLGSKEVAIEHRTAIYLGAAGMAEYVG